MAQIAFDLKIGVEPEGLGSIWFSWAILELAAEFGGQHGFRQIGDMRRHPRDREARGGGIGIVIIAVAPIGIGHHGLTPALVKGEDRQTAVVGRSGSVGVILDGARIFKKKKNKKNK